MADLAESCKDSCEKIGYYCKTEMNYGDSSLVFGRAQMPCIDDKTNAKWSKNYHPSYSKNTQSCDGFAGIPKTVSCTALPPDDGQTIRLCDCESPGNSCLRECVFKAMHFQSDAFSKVAFSK